MSRNVMKSFLYRIFNAFKLAWLGFKNPEIIKNSNFKMLTDLLCLIMKVAEENRHMMTHIAYIHPNEGEKEIVSIWAGAGSGADPIKRIQELRDENEMLKNQIQFLLNEKL
jgi:hypothetical protein